MSCNTRCRLIFQELWHQKWVQRRDFLCMPVFWKQQEVSCYSLSHLPTESTVAVVVAVTHSWWRKLWYFKTFWLLQFAWKFTLPLLAVVNQTNLKTQTWYSYLWTQCDLHLLRISYLMSVSNNLVSMFILAHQWQAKENQRQELDLFHYQCHYCLVCPLERTVTPWLATEANPLKSFSTS